MEEKAKQYLEESKKEKDYRQTNNEEGKKEERIFLSNDTLNTFFFLQPYGIRHVSRTIAD